MTREAKFNWMKDILEHMHRCQEQWQLADDGSARFAAEAMKRNLNEFKRLCESLETAEARPAAPHWAPRRELATAAARPR